MLPLCSFSLSLVIDSEKKTASLKEISTFSGAGPHHLPVVKHLILIFKHPVLDEVTPYLFNFGLSHINLLSLGLILSNFLDSTAPDFLKDSIAFLYQPHRSPESLLIDSAQRPRLYVYGSFLVSLNFVV